MSAPSNDAFTLTRSAGIYKAVQSAVITFIWLLGADICFQESRGSLKHERDGNAVPEWAASRLGYDAILVSARFLRPQTVKETNCNDEQVVRAGGVQESTIEQGHVPKGETGLIEKDDMVVEQAEVWTPHVFSGRLSEV